MVISVTGQKYLIWSDLVGDKIVKVYVTEDTTEIKMRIHNGLIQSDIDVVRTVRAELEISGRDERRTYTIEESTGEHMHTWEDEDKVIKKVKEVVTKEPIEVLQENIEKLEKLKEIVQKAEEHKSPFTSIKVVIEE